MIRTFNLRIYSMLAALLAVGAFASCEKDKTINSNISTVKELYYPEVGRYYQACGPPPAPW